MSKKLYIACFLGLVSLAFLTFCDRPQKNTDKQITKSEISPYLNHSDSARYVGMSQCRLCHQSIYNTFIETGMGKSFDRATKLKSSAEFQKASIYDKIADLHYRAYWDHDSLFIKEFRLDKKDTVHSRTEQVNYIIGSGQHTNSHLQTVNGYINQMPMTYYTQKEHWDLPPGFENGLNTRFSRKIGLECMSCHNAYPEFVQGSENKFKSLPGGIDCERCHGPGSIHVAERSTGTKIDTSKYIDYSIVNPAKLPIDAQFDICQRCHLQGNAVLKEGSSFYDFKPGQKLSDFISVFLPKYKNADEEFIMASHADRLKQSPCFIKSYERAGKQNSLKPYQGAMTCITCHDPHVSVRQTNKNVFNEACMKCHDQRADAGSQPGVREALRTAHRQLKDWSNCVSCHMPATGSTDIPHVSVHDHYIRKPVTKKEKDRIKTFVGLFPVNEKNPDALTRARAYIDQYSKFEQEGTYLDSASALLKDRTPEELYANIRALIHLHFIRQDFPKLISCVDRLGAEKCYSSMFIKTSYDNEDAWASYRIAEAYSNSGNNRLALRWFKKAVELAPYNLDFRNKLGNCLASENDLAGATGQFEFIMKENPKFVSSYSNLGYIKLLQGFPAEALRLYNIGKKLDPDNEALLLNLAGYYLYMKDKVSARKSIETILKKNPKNQRAAEALKQLTRI